MQRNKRKLRVTTTKLRLSDHCLAIEKGRRRSPKIDREDRLCQICNEEFIEDEKHFLLKCENYSDVRSVFLNNVLKAIQIQNNFPLTICSNSCSYVRIKKQSTIFSHSLDKSLTYVKKHYEF